MSALCNNEEFFHLRKVFRTEDYSVVALFCLITFKTEEKNKSLLMEWLCRVQDNLILSIPTYLDTVIPQLTTADKAYFT